MKRLIVANWKMNPDSSHLARKISVAVENRLRKSNARKVQTVICPPFVYLKDVEPVLRHTRLGSQDIAAFESGPHTGEISAGQLLGLGVSLALIGHSERRALGENDYLINQKVHAAIRAKIEPILCVGYGTKFSMSKSAERKIIANQLTSGLLGVRVKYERLAILYEPTWAISKGLGKGHAVSPEVAGEMIGFIKAKYPGARVLYGGSIDARTAMGFANLKIIDGGVVGAASLRADEFCKIVKIFVN